MADQEHGDAAASDDALAVAEEVAAMEAAAETAEDPASAKSDSPKVVRVHTRTSARPAPPKRAAASSANGSADGDQPANGSLTAGSSGPTPLHGETVDGAVSLSNTGAAVVNARSVDVRQGGIGRAEAIDIAVSQGGIGFARGERVSVEMGGVGAALGSDVRVTQGGVNTIIARDVRIEQAVVRTVIANNVHAERTTGVVLMVARHVEGDIRTLLDWRGAIAFGAAFGLVVSLFRRRR